MKKIIITSSLLFILICCFKNEKEYSEKYPSGVLKLKGCIKNNLLDGKVIRYTENGKISVIQNYVNGKLEGIEKAYIDSTTMMLISEYKNGEIVKQRFYDTITNRIQSTIDNNIARIYYKPNQPIMIICSQDTTRKKLIKFTNDGKLRAYEGPLDFLTREDSFNLSSSYPTWIEMIKNWEAKHK